MKWKLFGFGLLMLWQTSASQEVFNTSLNSGSLNVKIQNGGITSSLGESIVGDLGVLSMGFQQSFYAVSPVEMQIVFHNKDISWKDLLETGSNIRIFDLQGRSIVSFPAGLGLREFQSLVHKLPNRAFIFYSQSSKQDVRFVAYPNHFTLN